MKIYRWKFLVLCYVLLVMCVVTGCDDDDDDDDGNNPVLGAIHAVSDMGTIYFLKDESVASIHGFGSGTAGTVSPDQYDVHFETALPSDDTDVCSGDVDDDGIKDDDECTRFMAGSINLLKDQEYMFVLYGHFDDLEILEFEKPYHEFDTYDEDEDGDPEDENMEVQFFHLTEALGDIDVFLEPPGTNLSPTQAIGTVSLKEAFHALVDEGDYVVTFTAVGDTGTIYFTSETFLLDKQTRVAFVIRDGAGNGTPEVKVQLFGDQSGILIDRNEDTELRVIHAVPEGDNVDVYADDDFSTPFVSDIAFGQTSAFNTVDLGSLVDLSMDVTPASDPGVFLVRENLDLTQGTQNTFYIIGEADNWDSIKSTDYLRRVATHTQLKLVNGASATTLNFYITEPNSNITTLNPTSTLAFRLNSGWMQFDPGTYEITLTNSFGAIVYGPQTIELEAGGLYSVVATSNTSDPAMADVLLLDDFTN